MAAPRSLAWASAIGNRAVQRLARRAVAREAIEEEDEEEEQEHSPSETEAVEDGAPAEPPGDIAPHEADGLAALDDLPEDELPE